MVKRFLDLLRATIVSFEMFISVGFCGLYYYKPELFTSLGMFLQHSEVSLKTGLLVVYGLIFGFCLKLSLSILKPSDSKTRAVLAVWGEFFLLENRVFVALIFSSGGLLGATFGLFVADIQETIVAFILIVSFVISVISAFSLWRTDYILQRIVDQEGKPGS